MGYRLTCNSCEFEGAVESEHTAYSDARRHESDHPEHFVYIMEENGEPPAERD